MGKFRPAPTYPWRSWAEVPDRPPKWAIKRKFFVEFFAGMAGVTMACLAMGMAVLPPVELECHGHVEFPVDIMDRQFQTKIFAWIEDGAIGLAHFGTPCSSFSTARRSSWRSRAHARGSTSGTHI